MSPLGIILTLLTIGMVMTVPRRWVVLPLLIGVLYVPRDQGVDINPIAFPLIRVIILAAALRMISKGERLGGRFTPVDWMIILWGMWYIGSGMFRDGKILMWRLGDVYSALGVYFILRVVLREPGDIILAFKAICLLLPAVGVGMWIERATGENIFAKLYGGAGDVVLRGGHFRARGPYVNAILAGTNGAVCLPIAAYLWRECRKIAITGLLAASAIVVASGASGPIMTAGAGMGAMALWKWRKSLRAMLWGALLMAAALDCVMNDPVYFLIARIDISGGSTGWYRAALVQSAIAHLNEWWLVGTDYTQHWMPAGTSGIVGDHVDITNQYIQMGVVGGILLTSLFVAILYRAFASVRRALKRARRANFAGRFLIWTIGSILFAHVVTFWSVAYFDPSIILLFYLILATVAVISRATWPQRRTRSCATRVMWNESMQPVAVNV